MSEVTVAALVGSAVVDRSGARVGDVLQVFLDDVTGQPEWVTVRAGGRETFVPLAAARFDGGRVLVDATAEQVAGAPEVPADGHVSEREEAGIYRYYGLSFDRRGTGPRTTGPEGTDDAMTRSEEHLVARAPDVETTRVRLRRYVVTETATVQVPVRREEVRLETEPVPATGGSVTEVTDVTDATEEERDMILHAERPVVTTETVPVERVRLTKETVTGTETVTGEVRKEQIELDDPTTDRH